MKGHIFLIGFYCIVYLAWFAGVWIENPKPDPSLDKLTASIAYWYIRIMAAMAILILGSIIYHSIKQKRLVLLSRESDESPQE